MSRLPEVPEEARLATQLADALAYVSALEAYERGAEAQFSLNWRDGSARNNRNSIDTVQHALSTLVAKNFAELFDTALAFARGDVTKARDQLKAYYGDQSAAAFVVLADGVQLDTQPEVTEAPADLVAPCAPENSPVTPLQDAIDQITGPMDASNITIESTAWVDVQIGVYYGYLYDYSPETRAAYDAAFVAAGGTIPSTIRPEDAPTEDVTLGAITDAVMAEAVPTETSSEIDTFVDMVFDHETAQPPFDEPSPAPDVPAKEDEPVV